MTGVDANPEAHAHAAAKYTAPGVRFERDLVDRYSEPCDAVVFLQTIEHVEDPEAVLRHFKAMADVVYVSTPNVLTLAPEGAEKSDNPWHLKEYRAEEFGELCASVFDDVEMLGLFHARKLRAARAGAERRAGTPCTRRSASPSPSTTASPRRSPHATSRSGPARWSARSISSRCCVEAPVPARAARGGPAAVAARVRVRGHVRAAPA